MENLCKNFIQWAVVTIGLVVVGLGAPEVATGQMVPLPQDLEVQLALSALPAHLRDDATIYVLDPKAGYTVFKEGSNGFVALVGRTSTRFYQADWDYAYPTDQLIPMAYDAVGMEFHLKPWFDLARMRAEGASPSDAKERLRAGFTDGTYRAPNKGGISYMLSPIHRAYLAPEVSGEIFTVSFPHYMPYAPHVTGKQLGNFDPTAGPFALNHGQHGAGPHGYLVFMLPVGQIAEVRTEYANLLAELCELHANWCIDENSQ